MFNLFKKNFKKLLLASTMGSFIFVSNSFAENDSPSFCDLIKSTYQTCAKKSDEQFKNISQSEREKNCVLISMGIAIGMYDTLNQNVKDKGFAKNTATLLGLVCKDGCAKTDDYYSITLKKLCNK